MKALILIAFTFLCLSLGELTRYDNYQVLRVSLNDSSAETFFALADKLDLDVWQTNRIEGWADVMVPPSRTSVFDRYFPYEVRIENVQTTLDEHYEDMRNAKRNKNSTNGGIFEFDYFPPTGDISNFVNQKVTQYPGVAQRVTIGQTYNGNPIFGLRLGNAQGPTFFINCGIHAREWITVTTCCYIIDQLLGEDPEGPAILQEWNVFVVPILNTDGYDFTHTNTRLWRKDREPNPGSTCIGTDMNRNYGYGWGGDGSSPSACADTYRGASAFSCYGIYYLREFLTPFINQGRLFGFMDIHAYGAMFMSPYGYTYTLPPALDYNVMYGHMEAACNDIWAENGRTYAYGSVGNVIYLASGGSNDWAYGDGGCIAAFALEVFGSNFTPPTSWIEPIGREIWKGTKRLFLRIAK